MSTYRFKSRLRKDAGFSTRPVMPMLFVLSGLLIALQLLLSSVAYASSSVPNAVPGTNHHVATSGYTFGSNQPLDLASVSVVRLVATYIAPVPGPVPGCTNTLTGLGVLVGSWPTTAGSSDLTNWVMTDGSLVNPDPSGISCGAGKPTATLTTIQVYVNDAYTSASTPSTSSTNPILTALQCQLAVCTSTPGTAPTPIKCQATPCANGIALVPFHTTTPQPFLDMATADQSTPAPFGVGLTDVTGVTGLTVDPARASQSLTPVSVADVSNINTKSELGTPVVSELGQVLDMHIKATTDPGGTIRSYVTTQLTPGQSGHTNSLRDSWNSGISDYYQAHYADAQTAFRNAGTNNTFFRAGVVFWNLATAKVNGTTTGTGGNRGGKTPKPVTQPTPTGTNIFGYPIAENVLTWILIALLVLLVLIFVLVTFFIVRRQMHKRKEFAKLDHIAEIEAAQIAQQEREEHIRAQQAQSSSQNNSPGDAGAPLLTQVQPSVLAPPVTNLHCPHCGAPVNTTDNFCANCRSPLSLTDTGQRPASSPLPALSVSPPGVISSAAFSEMPTEEIIFGAAQNGTGTENTMPLVARDSTPRADAPLEQFTGHNVGLVVGTSSNPGIKRQHKPNEDSLFAAEGMLNNNSQAPQFGLFVVADGMGGHANGQDASRLAIKTIVDTLLSRLTSNEPFTDADFAQLLADGVQKANLAVHERNMESHADMGTTMTATLIVGTTAYMANVGDSRTYLYRQGELKKVTNDHSVVASLVEAGIIKPDDIYTHPKRNQIYRSLGEKPVVDVDTFQVPLQPGDKVILCSDGLWDMVRDPAIKHVLDTVHDPTQTRLALIQAALDGGGEDNVSVIVVHIAASPQGNGLTDVQVLARPEAPQYPVMRREEV